MKAFLLINLAADAAFEQPALTWVRKSFPDVTTFDVDVQSEEMLQQYALRLLREASESIIYFNAGEGKLHQLMMLLEELLQPHPHRLILLQGEHPRLQRMLEARAGIRYKLVSNEEDLQEAVSLFFS